MAAALAVLMTGMTAGGLAPPHGTAAGGAARSSTSAVASPAGSAAAPLISRAGVTSSPAEQVVLTAYVAKHWHRTPREIARWLIRHKFHWRLRKQFRYLSWLWERESGWNRFARNPYSGAYGIPQALPGWKMASAGPHWRRNPWTQIRWGLRYIRARYGRPRGAWRHEHTHGWY